MTGHWRDAPDDEHFVHAVFGDGSEAYTTLEHAADALDFIDRAKGIEDLRQGVTFRSHTGTTYSTGIPVTAEPGSLAGRILGL